MDYSVNYYDKVSAQPVEWLWYPYIPFGKITIIEGDPGEGKSTFILNVLSLITKGAKIPNLGVSFQECTVIYQNNEDGVADTIVPRLIACGADLSKVAYIDETKKLFTIADQGIEKVLEETGARVVVIDPIQAYFGERDMNRAADVRSVLGSLSRIAEKYNCAMILIGHLSKVAANKGLYRGLGSIDIAATARSVLLISKAIDELRVMSVVKNNIAPFGKSILFSIRNNSSLHWIKYSSITSKEIMDNDFSELRHFPVKSNNAQEIIRSCIESGVCQATEIVNACLAQGISRRTISSTKHEMRIVSEKSASGWIWKLGENNE